MNVGCKAVWQFILTRRVSSRIEACNARILSGGTRRFYETAAKRLISQYFKS